ncbi:MAG: EF-hand domain-containing protein [Desulfovermiculus sp.]|nr:EF-hand domain-containing protein [Desulfovermiculus sp.]
MKIRTGVLTLCLLVLAASVAWGGKAAMSGDQGFSTMDTNNDGFVSQEEYLAPFKEWDANDDGKLSLKEWLSNHGQLMDKSKGQSKMKYPTMQEVDKNNDGKVSAEEFEAVFPNSSESFGMLDLNQDGIVDGDEWEEFRKIHTKAGKGYHKKSN